MRMRWMVGLLFGAAIGARAQVDTAVAYGSVTGHVYLAEGNLPARLAHVALQPVSATESDLSGRGKQTQVYETGLDGAFRMEHVAEGNYYVVVNRLGYPPPIERFTAAQLANPTEEIQKQLEALPRVSVGNGTSVVDVRLYRGASIAGQVRYEDGEPMPGVQVVLEQKDARGKWTDMRFTSGMFSGMDRKVTDESGRFRVDGLMAGEYLVKVELSMDKTFQDRVSGGRSSTWSRTLSSVTFYSGDTPRISAAKPVKLLDGEQATGDLSIAVSSLHTVQGSVVDARTGQALNGGSVQLLYEDDRSTGASAYIDPDTRSFEMEFVPEGKYVLTVQGACEGVPGTSEHDHGSPMPALTTVRAYDNAELPLVVHGDVSAVTLAVKDRPVTAKDKERRY